MLILAVNCYNSFLQFIVLHFFFTLKWCKYVIILVFVSGVKGTGYRKVIENKEF